MGIINLNIDVYNLQGLVVKEKYLILSLIAHGGMSLIYLVKILADNTIGVMKVCDNSCNQKVSAICSEANILQKLNGLEVPHYYDSVCIGQYHAIIIEYISGITLTDIIAKRDIISINNIINITIAICRVISSMHTFDPPIFYCDMKSSNVIITDSGKVRLIDFGAAVQYDISISQTNTYQKAGTEKYAAPEQFNTNSKIDSRTDIYGIGMLLNDMYKSTSTKNRKLERIICRCTEHDMENRYYDCAELMCELLCVGGHSCVVKFQIV